MSAGRYLSRIDRAWHLASAAVSSNHLGKSNACHLDYPKGCNSYHALSSYRLQRGVNLLSFGSMGRDKRRKSTNLLWRPVSTQAQPNSSGGFAEDAGMLESESLVQIESREQVGAEGFSVTLLSESTHISTTLDDHADATKTGGVSMVSIEKHSVSIEVGSSLMRFIKGKGGATQKSIEEETGVNLIFPSSRKEDSLIIEGGSAESVKKASEKIQVIIDEAVRSPSFDYSHFISLPLAIYPELVDKLVRFQNSVLGNCDHGEELDGNTDEQSNGDSSEDEGKGLLSEEAQDVAVNLNIEDGSDQVKVDISNIHSVTYKPKAKESNSSSLSELGIDKSIFIRPKTFHLTVLMLKLWNKERVSAAAEVLQSVSSKVADALDGRPVYIRLKGLDCMRGSLAKARVLYTPVEEIGNEQRLMRACQVIIDAYVEAGLVLERDAHQKLKLHATVMNARHRKRDKRRKKFDSFDARGVVEKHGSEDWGDYHIREAHLSQRFVFDDDGYYHRCASIPFPPKVDSTLE